MPLTTWLDGRPQTRLRGIALMALTDSVVLQTRVDSSDSGGGVTETWANAGTVACRVDPLTGAGGSRLTGGKIDDRSNYVLTMPAATSVLPGGRAVISGRGTFEVTTVRTRTGGQTTVAEVIQVF